MIRRLLAWMVRGAMRYMPRTWGQIMLGTIILSLGLGYVWESILRPALYQWDINISSIDYILLPLVLCSFSLSRFARRILRGLELLILWVRLPRFKRRPRKSPPIKPHLTKPMGKPPIVQDTIILLPPELQNIISLE